MILLYCSIFWPFIISIIVEPAINVLLPALDILIQVHCRGIIELRVQQ